jgi:hypothetical protein
MPIGYTVIMIRPEGAEFPPEYSDRNLIVKTVCDSCRDSPVVSVISKTQFAQLIQSLLQQPLQHSAVVAVLLYVLLLLYRSLSLSLIVIPQKSAHYLTFPLDT